MKRRLADTKLQVKQELALHNNLSEKVTALTKSERDQGQLINTLDGDLNSIKAKLVDYEQTTRLKED